MAKPDNLEAYACIAEALKTTICEAQNDAIFVYGSDISGINVFLEARKETADLEICTVTLCNPKLDTYNPQARRSIMLLNPKAVYLADEVVSLSDYQRNGFVIGPGAVALITRGAPSPIEELKSALIPA